MVSKLEREIKGREKRVGGYAFEYDSKRMQKWTQ